jgi:hypothetical protein
MEKFELKICNVCGCEKSIDLFYKLKTGKFGVEARCKECRNKNKKSFYKENREIILIKVKKYNNKNKKSISEYAKFYYNTDKGQIKNKRKKYRLVNGAQIKKYNQKYYIDNKEKLILNAANYQKNRKQTDSLFKLKCSIRALIKGAFNRKFTKKSKKTIEILGCSFKKFENYLEKQFDDKMSWDNQGNYWHLDHIKPISLAKNEEELNKLNHYTNFQPLSAIENRIKSNHYI